MLLLSKYLIKITKLMKVFFNKFWKIEGKYHQKFIFHKCWFWHSFPLFFISYFNFHPWNHKPIFSFHFSPMVYISCLIGYPYKNLLSLVQKFSFIQNLLCSWSPNFDFFFYFLYNILILYLLLKCVSSLFNLHILSRNFIFSIYVLFLGVYWKLWWQWVPRRMALIWYLWSYLPRKIRVSWMWNIYFDGCEVASKMFYIFVQSYDFYYFDTSFEIQVLKCYFRSLFFHIKSRLLSLENDDLNI